MREKNDRAYFLLRARQERDIASSSEDNSVALTHFRFADEYERRAAQMPEPAMAELRVQAS